MFSNIENIQIANALRQIATIFEKHGKIQDETIVSNKGKRGRRPGSVSDEIRCQHKINTDNRCKNRATKGTLCGKHL